jgi:predicted Zn-ribbon and HTH transcriptional regulator
MQKQQRRSENTLFMTPARVAVMGNCGFNFFSPVHYYQSTMVLNLVLDFGQEERP